MRLISLCLSVISRSSSQTRPSSGGVNELMQRSNVLLPVPLGPIITTTSPRSTVNEILSSTRLSPNAFDSSLTVKMLLFPIRITFFPIQSREFLIFRPAVQTVYWRVQTIQSIIEIQVSALQRRLAP